MFPDIFTFHKPAFPIQSFQTCSQSTREKRRRVVMSLRPSVLMKQHVSYRMGFREILYLGLLLTFVDIFWFWLK